MKESIASFINGRPRRLTPEEIELWLAVAKTVAPRPGCLLPQGAAAKPAPAREEPDPMTEGASAPDATVQVATPVSPAPARKAPAPLAPLERRLRQKLARGRAAPEAAIDLHGLRRQEAFVALRRFLSGAQRDGAKLVLVVTGKGARGGAESEEAGVLKRSVPQWLRAPEYHSIVVGFEEAARPHGGAGALYVRLRRRDRAPRGMQSQ